jgi:hypothetical protein
MPSAESSRELSLRGRGRRHARDVLPQREPARNAEADGADGRESMRNQVAALDDLKRVLEA